MRKNKEKSFKLVKVNNEDNIQTFKNQLEKLNNQFYSAESVD